MAILPGRRLGPYEILSAIGAGGMGEVYKARDTRLDRIVAIKVLSTHLADRAELRERFEREAKTIASLNHPHICVLHDIGHQDGTDYLVMEYLEGETLAQRLLKGSLPIQQVLQYAIEISDALDKAHRKGVTHRDLKPGNIMLTKSGTKLLDFGLAKLKQEVAPATPLSQLPTMQNAITGEGTILGTLQYMAPEQVEAKEVDTRTDIFAFGAVVYEMATGKKAFEGKTSASVMAKILEAEPPSMASLQPMTPPMLDRVVKKCLAKEPEKRWQVASDLCDELKWIAEGGSQVGLAPTAAVKGIAALWRRPVVLLLCASLLTAAAGIVLSFALRQPMNAQLEANRIRLSINPPENGKFSGAASTVPASVQVSLSPDGNAITYVAAVVSGKPMLWVRSLDDTVARPLAGTDDAEDPFWSPDGRWIGFFSSGKIKKVPYAGGGVQVITEAAAEPRGGSWGPNDTILFATNGAPIFRVAASGGPATALTKLDPARKEANHRFPCFLPDGKNFLYNIRGTQAEYRGIYVGSLDGGVKKFLVGGRSNAQYVAPGYLLFMDGDTLRSQAFDADRLELKGQPFTVALGVGVSGTNAGAFSASGPNLLAYAGPMSSLGRLTWLDRSGNPSGTAGQESEYTDFRVSPDETRVAASVTDLRTSLQDIWMIDLVRGSTSRFTNGPLISANAVWSPDGGRIAYRDTRTGVASMLEKSAGGGGTEDPLFMPAAGDSMNASTLTPNDWSTDGRYLLFSAGSSAFVDLWVLPLAGDRKPVKLSSSSGSLMHGNFSPDGHLIAYTSDESGKFEVYAQTFPASDKKWTVSTSGGFEPRWREDGREIYYLSGDRKLMAVAVEAGPSFGVPKALFQTRVTDTVNPRRMHYVPSRDGKRFLVNIPVGDPSPVPITIVLNWTAGLKK